ncbi:hypothetical protein PQR66_30275 [Paraburkholderia agricolaris]|uniref:Uncharacterized protein n=1 Tax=Paraburkholderia agricolaris TaxID=2152888 RepID=A0ABW8ZXI6_9BURK
MLANSGDVWKSSQIGSMLATHAVLHSALGPEPMISGILRLVSNLDDGNSAAFARRIGLAKTTVHYWLQQGGIPSMAGHLRMASQTGVTLVELLTGQVEDEPKTLAKLPALTTLFPDRKRRASPRTHNVEHINMQLNALIRSDLPVSAAEAARRLNVHHRQLYVFANQAARSLSRRWTQHRQHRGIESRERARKLIEPALKAIAAEGKSANLRLLTHRIPVGTPGILKHAIALIKEAKLGTGSDEQIHSED